MNPNYIILAFVIIMLTMFISVQIDEFMNHDYCIKMAQTNASLPAVCK